VRHGGTAEQRLWLGPSRHFCGCERWIANPHTDSDSNAIPAATLPNINTNSDANSHSHSHSDGYTYGNHSASSNGHAYSDGATADNTYTTASPNAATSPIVRRAN